MSIKGWLLAAGFTGLYYLYQYGEWTSFSLGADVNGVRQGRIDGEAWVNQGAGLITTSGSIRAISSVVNAFNDFMDDVFLDNGQYGLLKELMVYEDGVLVLPDMFITLPNGLVLNVLDGGQVGSFRITDALETWRGFCTPIGFGMALGYLCFRLKTDPTMQFMLPGSDALKFRDPLTNIVKLGSECTPPQGIYLTDVEYISSCSALFLFICDILQKLGLTRILSAWVSKYLLNRSIRRTYTEAMAIKDEIEEHSVILASVVSDLDELKRDYFATINNPSVSKLDKIFEGLKKLGYRPYG